MKKEFYFDDEEIGLAESTSHPQFNALVKDSFYYDLSDDFSPFGNDTGAETLLELSEWIQENESDEGILEWMYDYIDSFGFKYESKGVADLESIEDINQIHREDEFMIKCMDEAIIATGFGQLKIVGAIDENLKAITRMAILRQIRINKEILSSQDVDLGKLIRVVDGQSTRLNKNGETNHLTTLFIERMEIMKRDLGNLK